MTRWEHRALASNEFSTDVERWEEIARLGKEGWEMFATDSDRYIRYYYFKRPIEDGYR